MNSIEVRLRLSRNNANKERHDINREGGQGLGLTSNPQSYILSSIPSTFMKFKNSYAAMQKQRKQGGTNASLWMA